MENFSLETEWSQVTLWPVLWVGHGECECCDGTAYAIGLSFGPWTLAFSWGG